MLLTQIERRLKDLMGDGYIPKKLTPEPPPRKIKPKLITARVKVQENEKAVEQAEVQPVVEASSAVIDSMVNAPFDLRAFLTKYGMTKEEKEGVTKKMGVTVPIDLHARMSKFLKEHPEGPKSLVELALICIKHSMEHLEANNGLVDVTSKAES